MICALDGYFVGLTLRIGISKCGLRSKKQYGAYNDEEEADQYTPQLKEGSEAPP